jgi:hypothetical protein
MVQQTAVGVGGRFSSNSLARIGFVLAILATMAGYYSLPLGITIGIAGLGFSLLGIVVGIFKGGAALAAVAAVMSIAGPSIAAFARPNHSNTTSHSQGPATPIDAAVVGMSDEEIADARQTERIALALRDRLADELKAFMAKGPNRDEFSDDSFAKLGVEFKRRSIADGWVKAAAWYRKELEGKTYRDFLISRKRGS